MPVKYVNNLTFYIRNQFNSLEKTTTELFHKTTVLTKFLSCYIPLCLSYNFSYFFFLTQTHTYTHTQIEKKQENVILM